MDKKQNILLVGGGDFTKKVIKLLAQFDEYNIIGYTDIKDKGTLFDVEYLGEDKIAHKLKEQHTNLCVIICIVGNISLLKKKNDLIDYYKGKGFNFPTIISNKAFIDDSATIGEGVVIFDNAYLDFNTVISEYSVINLGALICHDVRIGPNVVISPRTVIAGGTTLASNVFIGTNTTVNPYLKICSDVLIGSGSMVNKSVEERGIYVGNPLKKIK